MSGGTFRLQLTRFRRHAQLAVARSGFDVAPEILDATRTELEAANAQLAAIRGDDARPDLRLAAALGLTPDQLDFLWAVVARAADPMLAPILAVLSGSDARRGLSASQYATIMGLDPERSQELATILSPAHPLLRHRFLVGPQDTPIDACTPLTVPPRVWSYLRGDDDVEDQLAFAGGRVRVPHDAQFDAHQHAALARLVQAIGSIDPMVIVVEGPVGAGRRTAIAKAAAASRRPVIAIDLARIVATPQALETALAAQMRECLLADAIPVVAEVDELIGAEGDRSERLNALARALETAPGAIAVTSATRGLDLGVRGRRVMRVEWPVPSTDARRDLWISALGDDAARLESGLDEIALRYRLGAGGIQGATAAARTIKESRGPSASLEATDVLDGIRNNIAESLGELAQRIEIKQSWDDLVLPPDTLESVKGLISRVRHAHQVYEKWGFKAKMPRGIGVAALFSGPPGTGKTMVAGLLARELELELYQVDLSKVVSKWVGETEKQLAKIFAAAEAGHALLLFDEADSLFAKRTEVKSAVDRYANLEVNYLLQRIESFGGVTILTTNLDTSIDPALRRRLASHIVFQSPEEAESTQLWKRMLTIDAPITEPLGFDKLARSFPAMVGANIRNAVLAAAFMAASEGVPISHKHLERAARGEYRAMGRALG